MNAKKAKSLRRAVRINKSERDKQYVSTGRGMYPGTLTLVPGCGRSLYKRMKERTA